MSAKILILSAIMFVSGCAAPETSATLKDASQAPRYFGADTHITPSQPNAILRYADHQRGFADLRLPKGEGPFPLAVIYHGGCWKAGIATQDYMAPLATAWQAQGIATLNVDYREVGDGGGWPGSFEDWQASAALIDQVAEAHSIDPARVTLVGHSAGALPALWLASAQNADGPTGERDAVKAHAAIIFDGPADVGLESAAFDRLCRFSAVSPFMGGSVDDVPARYAALSPSNNAPQLAEALFVQAVLPPPPDAAQAALGIDVVVATNQSASHFDVIAPGSAVYDRNEDAILRVLRGR